MDFPSHQSSVVAPAVDGVRSAFDAPSRSKSALPTTSNMMEGELYGGYPSSSSFVSHNGVTPRRLSASASIRPTSISILPYLPEKVTRANPPSPSETVSTTVAGSPIDEKFEEADQVCQKEVRSTRQLWRSRFIYWTQCYSVFLGGWNDSATVRAHRPHAVPRFLTFDSIGPAPPHLSEVLSCKQRGPCSCSPHR